MAEHPSTANGSMDLMLTLRYRHAVGDLAPYFDGLRSGSLYGTRCACCAAVWAPPRLVCACGSSKIEWVRLSGRGTVISATRTQTMLPATSMRGEMGFAMVRCDGATNTTLARFKPEDEIAAGQRVVLAPTGSPDGSHPVQLMCVTTAKT